VARGIHHGPWLVADGHTHMEGVVWAWLLYLTSRDTRMDVRTLVLHYCSTQYWSTVMLSITESYFLVQVVE
jgi:hypothetical protein